MMLFSHDINVLERSLTWSAERHKILSHNLANADTPGYKRRDLDFPSQLEKKLQLERTHPRHLPGTADNVMFLNDNRGTVRVDDNGVDIESESVRMAENALYYQGVAQELRNSFRRLRTVIQGK